MGNTFLIPSRFLKGREVKKEVEITVGLHMR